MKGLSSPINNYAKERGHSPACCNIFMTKSYRKQRKIKQYSCSHYSSVPCAVQLYSYARLYLGLLSVSLQLFDFWTILFPCCSMLTAKKKHSFGQTTASGDLVARLRRSKVADASRTVPYIYFFTVRRCHGFMVHESVYNESTAVLVSDSGTPALLKG